MKDIFYLDKILSEILLKPCSKCEHPRENHPCNRKCEIKICTCKSYG